jgi:hypothetical protein
MECVTLDVERLHLGIADFDTLFVGGGVERAFDLQAGLGGSRGNQLDHSQHRPIQAQESVGPLGVDVHSLSLWDSRHGSTASAPLARFSTGPVCRV